MLASSLEKSEFLISPNFPDPNAQRSVLIKYRQNGIKIAINAVLATSKPKNPEHPINEHIFNWIIQACGYALRINDQKNSESFFQLSMVLYLKWLQDFPFACELELKENYIRIMMLHLSQIFVNPSFNDTTCYIFINKIRLAFINLKEQYSYDTWSVVLKVLFYGNTELFKLKTNEIEEPTKIEFARTTLSVLYKCHIYPNDNFWSQFDEQLNELFKCQLFCTAWISKFSELYIERLKMHDDKNITEDQLNYLNFVIQFYKKKIDMQFNEINKQKSFTTIVYSWCLFAQDNKLLLHKKWNIDEIKKMILPWFSLNVEWTHDETMNATHPLFLLIKMGEGQLFHQKDDQLESIASQIVRKALCPEVRNDLYWYFPQYSYFFLVKNPKLLDEIQNDFIKYVQAFKDSDYSKNAELNIYVCLILMLLIQRNQQDSKMVNTLSQFFISKTNDFSVFLVSFICLFFLKNSELFWSMYNSCFIHHEFDDIIDILSIISCFSPHVNGSDFVNNVSLNNNLWNFLYSPPSNTYRERLILSLFFLSEGSNYFVVNPDDGATLIQYFIIKSNDTKTFPVLANFFKMTRLSILCGGALNASKPEEIIYSKDQSSTSTKTESFITRSYIVTVFNNNHLMIHHGLGSTIFEVDDSKTSFCNGDDKYDSYQEYIPAAIENEDILSEVSSSSYVSKNDPASELLEAVEKMDSLFLSNTDFEPYSPPPNPDNVSSAHAFLCDTGFISSSSEKNIRRIPFSTMINTIEAKLDNLESTPSINIPIIQIDENSKIYSKDSEALQKLVQVDLKKVQTKVCKLEFVYATEVTNLIEMIEKYGFCIIFNETSLFLNHFCNEIKANFIISLIPDVDYYIVDLMFSKNFDSLAQTARRKIFGERKIDDISFIVPNEMLANFITLVAIIFYSSAPLSNENDQNNSNSDAANENPNSNNLDNRQQNIISNDAANSNSSSFTKCNETTDNQVLGPELFVSGFKKRITFISKEFEKANQGKMPLLIEITQES